MSSLSQQPSQKRPSSRDDREGSPSPSRGTTDDRVHTPASEDSQTVLINNPPSSFVHDSREGPTSTTDAEASGDVEASPPSANDSRICWICRETEADDNPSPWRSPCPCVLVAHEKCLLDWVASKETPGPRRHIAAPTRIECPQCKQEIHIVRPQSLIVDAVNMIERAAGNIAFPALGLTLVGTVWAGCLVYGAGSVFLVFGAEDARRIMDLRHGEGFWPRVRLGVGLSMIPPILITSRTRWADTILPVVPLAFLASIPEYMDRVDINVWPPSAAMTFAALPYIKMVYHLLYEALFGNIERRWIAEIQPRAGEGGDAPEDDNFNQGNGDDNLIEGDMVMELGLEVELVGPEEAENENEADANNQQHHDVEGAQGNAGDQNVVANAHANIQRQDNIVVSTGRFADTLVGALAFPAVSSLMGFALKCALPRSWVIPESREWWRHKNGLLTSRWGRTVVGGCLFVALKDAVVLYCRWKQAQNFRKRHILDYDRSKKRVVRP